ncbi:MAG: hypothetical protein IVW36_06355 [Dehalococcoidia bacterium]|nr:hypothetical protein [Dehalococcoidia bacterium]
MDDSTVDESMIEATIRRVAEAQAARDAATADSEAPAAASARLPIERSAVAVAGEEDAVERSAGTAAGEAGGTAPDDAVAARAPEESAIEATIRRVEAARLAREQEAPAPPGQFRDGAGVAADERDVARAPLVFAPREHGGAAAALAVAEPAAEGWLDALARIERGLDAATVLLRQILARLERTAAAAPAAMSSSPPVAPAAEDDDWEDAPTPLPQMAFGAPPRPVIFRDAAPDDERAGAAPPMSDETAMPPPAAAVETRRGFDLLPRSYRITVEDKRRGVDLVPLHRALLGMDGVRDMSLLSYNNGVAIVSLETVNDLDPSLLERAVGRAMSRRATVETHNERTLVVKLAED